MQSPAEVAATKLVATNFAQAAGLFDCIWEGSEPDDRAKLWQRGLALFFVGRFAEGSAQFDSDLSSNGGDVEELAWRFCCDLESAVQDGASRHEAALQAASNLCATPMAKPDPRPVMQSIIELFKDTEALVIAAAAEIAGRIDAVLQAGLAASQQPHDGSPLPTGFTSRQICEDAPAYASYYCALWLHSCFGGGVHNERALELFNQAAAAPSLDFMGLLMTMHAGAPTDLCQLIHSDCAL